MTPQEKWKRISDPQTAEDYGISMTETELRQVPEAWAIIGPQLEALQKIRHGQIAEVQRAMGSKTTRATYGETVIWASDWRIKNA